MQARRRGEPLLNTTEQMAQQKQEALDACIKEVAEALIARQAQREEVLDELTEEMKSIDVLDAAKFQHQNLKETSAKLVAMQKNLKKHLEEAEEALRLGKVRENELRLSLIARKKAYAVPKQEDPRIKALYTYGGQLMQSLSEAMVSYRGSAW